MTEALWVLEGPFSAGHTRWLLGKGTLVDSLRQCVTGSRGVEVQYITAEPIAGSWNGEGQERKNRERNTNKSLRQLLRSQVLPFSTPHLFPTFLVGTVRFSPYPSMVL